jgi:hypothetical protein
MGIRQNWFRFCSSSLIAPHSSLLKRTCFRFHSTNNTSRYFFDENNYDSLRRGDPQENDKNKDYKGWNLMIKRSRDIIDALSEKDANKILHIYCQPDLVKEMGEVRFGRKEFLIFFGYHRSPISLLVDVQIMLRTLT